MDKLLVYAVGLFFLAYGVAFTLLPLEMAQFVTGAAPATASGVIDMRATYGGMSVAVGILLIVLGGRAEWGSRGLLASAIVLRGMAGGRVIGMVLDGSPNMLMYLYLAGELMFAALALILSRSFHIVLGWYKW